MRGPSRVLRIPFLYQSLFSIFPALQEGNAECCILFQNHTWINFKKCLSLNNVNCLHVVYRPQPATLLKKETLADVFSCEYCKISKTTFSGRTTPVAAFEYSAKILAFSFIMLTGISVLWVAFRMPNFFLTSSKTSFKLTQEKWKCDPLLLLRLGQEILTVYGSTSWNSGILRSFTELVKSDFKIFIVFLFTYQSNFIIWFYFIWWHGFNSFPKLPII